MPNTVRYILRGDELVALLQKTTHDVKWLREMESFRISAAMAICIVRAEPYVGKCSRSRVYYIRPLAEVEAAARHIERDDAYWDDRAILRYQDDQRAIPQRRKNLHLNDCWIAMLTRDPQPRSWRRDTVS